MSTTEISLTALSETGEPPAYRSPRGGWKLVISDAVIAQLVLHDDVIIWAAIVAHSKRRTQFTLQCSRWFETKLAHSRSTAIALSYTRSI